MTFDLPSDEVHGPFAFEREGHNFSFVVTLKWIPVDVGQVARCGRSGSIEVGTTRGISVKEVESLKNVAEGTIGIKDVMSIKSGIEESFQSEIEWTETFSVTQKFDTPSPQCGGTLYSLYRRDKIYEITAEKKRIFRKPIFIKLPYLRERTALYYMQNDKIDNDPECPCPPPSDHIHTGRIRFIIGKLVLQADMTDKGGGWSFEFGKNQYTLPAGVDREGYIEMPKLHDFVWYLADLPPEMQAAVCEYQYEIDELQHAVTLAEQAMPVEEVAREIDSEGMADF